MEYLVQRIAEKAATNVEKEGTIKTKKLTIKTLQKCVKDKETISITVFMYIDLYSILEYLVDGAISSRSGNKGDNESDNYGSSGGGCGGIEGALWELVAVAHISLSWGAKKKESTNSNETPSNSSCPCVGDHVIVSNRGSKWEHLATIVEIIESTLSAVVKWDTTLKKDTVDLADCKQYDVDKNLDRKRKATDFLSKFIHS